MTKHFSWERSWGWWSFWYRWESDRAAGQAPISSCEEPSRPDSSVPSCLPIFPHPRQGLRSQKYFPCPLTFSLLFFSRIQPSEIFEHAWLGHAHSHFGSLARLISTFGKSLSFHFAKACPSPVLKSLSVSFPPGAQITLSYLHLH